MQTKGQKRLSENHYLQVDLYLALAETRLWAVRTTDDPLPSDSLDLDSLGLINSANEIRFCFLPSGLQGMLVPASM